MRSNAGLPLRCENAKTYLRSSREINADGGINYNFYSTTVGAEEVSFNFGTATIVTYSGWTELGYSCYTTTV